jgi:hypothetical protein
MDGLYDQLRIAVHTVWVRKWLAMGVAWGLCLAGWLAIALIPNSYESKARVFAEMQSILPQQVGITVADRAAELLKVKQTLTSTENLQNVVAGPTLTCWSPRRRTWRRRSRSFARTSRSRRRSTIRT